MAEATPLSIRVVYDVSIRPHVAVAVGDRWQRVTIHSGPGLDSLSQLESVAKMLIAAGVPVRLGDEFSVSMDGPEMLDPESVQQRVSAEWSKVVSATAQGKKRAVAIPEKKVAHRSSDDIKMITSMVNQVQMHVMRFACSPDFGATKPDMIIKTYNFIKSVTAQHSISTNILEAVRIRLASVRWTHEQAIE